METEKPKVCEICRNKLKGKRWMYCSNKCYKKASSQKTWEGTVLVPKFGNSFQSVKGVYVGKDKELMLQQLPELINDSINRVFMELYGHKFKEEK